MSYSINLIWINKELNDSKYCLPEVYLDNIVKWAKWNRKGRVNLWYYSNLCTSAQISNTLDLFRDAQNTSVIDLNTILSLEDSYSYITSTDHKTHPIVDLFKDKSIPVYWKADISRYVVLNYLSEHEPYAYNCYSDLDMSAYDIECSFNKNPLYMERLKFFGILFCHSKSTTNGIEDGFIITWKDSVSVARSMRLVMIDSACLLMDFLRTLAYDTDEELNRLVKHYFVDEWGFTNLTIMFHFDALIRDQKLKIETEAGKKGIRLKGSCLGISSARYLLLDEYVELINKYPVLILEVCNFYYWPGQFSLANYSEYLSIRHKKPPNKGDEKNMCYFASDCNDSNFSMSEEAAMRFTALFSRGERHYTPLLKNVGAISIKELDKYGLVR